jgi:hypothetical protein
MVSHWVEIIRIPHGVTRRSLIQSIHLNPIVEIFLPPLPLIPIIPPLIIPVTEYSMTQGENGKSLG